ncbi:L-histidine N(alpha)-methyltransferase [Cellulophaga sp. HaHaR_3_176]|uniref:L-histidine N(alpha)-methyltransferase n=1 Tax=Cellulophaga sp. HaHaR_3_176 TaxID=1942464 RepID=UPI001C1FBB66|nr:L-histidine N(alpha)-methyltransferase [Cellulophaga sp. HaHaR_3_176]QWX85267.1 L-histidine N(alpha)-methyltransferase [Cellulophaga sp. HaHaR_3_176]
MAVHRNQTSEIGINREFLEHVDKGLNCIPKFLSSRYFYDEIGDQLFVKIMNLPEYYLTRAEHEILKNQTSEIIKALQINKDTYFELIELGAGDGTKTKELLKPLVEQGYKFSYLPIDISGHALKNLKNSLKEEIPNLSVTTKQGDYFGVLDSIKDSKHPKIVLFLGSNLGNLEDKQAYDFLYKLGSSLKTNDKIFLGLDLVKSKDIVLPAYNDKQGITAQFNLNLLHRINKEFDADFDLNYFEHQPEYTEVEGIAKSYLVSTKNQIVDIKALDKKITFEKDEKIHTEISRKYNDNIINSILENTDLSIQEKLTDSQNYFSDYILKRD